MDRPQQKVAGFHHKYGFAMNLDLREMDPDIDDEIAAWGKHLLSLSGMLKERAMDLQDAGDPRFYRVYHKLEEVGELAIALGARDEIETADALGDLIYLALGDAVTFNLPMQEVFDEIHRSNMSKSRKEGDKRMKDRSPESGFSPPDIRGAIEKGRSRCSDHSKQ